MRPILMRPPLVRLILAPFLTMCCAFAGAVASAAQSQGPVIHHDLTVTLDPATHRLKVRDRIRVPAALVTAPLTISLNADLNVHAVSGGLRLLPMGSPAQDAAPAVNRDDHTPTLRVPVNDYRIDGVVPGKEMAGELDYEGVINYTVQESGGEYARAFSESPGLIEPRGVYL